MIQVKGTAEYERQGIQLHKGSQITKVDDLGNGIKRVHYKEGDKESTIRVDCVLWAVGRKPEIEQ